MKRIRVTLLLSLAGLLAGCSAAIDDDYDSATPHDSKASVMTVYKSPTCGCCSAWIDHVREAGFTVEVVEESDVGSSKRELGVPARLGSCHTAVIDGYVIEGHVPAADIRRLLAERPAGKGIAVPGMPIGSPGMEMGERRDPYEVLIFSERGETTVFSSHPQTR